MPIRVKHGHTRGGRPTPEYYSWHGMYQRCYNKNTRSYKRYGGRGIKMCERWLGENGFANFLADMGLKPSPSHSIDRFPNKDGDYEPSNCRWATPKEQRNNRDNPVVELKTHCPRGHSYSNAYIDKKGFRQCRECAKLWARQRRAKAKSD